MTNDQDNDLKAQLIAWLDSDTIAELIIDAMDDEGMPPTFENAQAIWLDVLTTELPQGIRSSTQVHMEASLGST